MTAPNELLRQVLRNVSFCQALPAAALEPQLIQQVTEITGLAPELIVRLGRLIATNGSLVPIQLLINSGHIDKAPGLRYRLRVHSKTGGVGPSKQEARQGVTLVVASSLGRLKLSMTVSLSRVASESANERRMARVKWVWVIDTRNQRQVRRHSFVISGVTPNTRGPQKSKRSDNLPWPREPRI